MDDLVPDKAIAEGSGSGTIVLGGRTRAGKRSHVQYEIFAGGVAGRNGKDGASATSFHLSNGKVAPVEIIESEFPTQVERLALLRDSGGLGGHPGGEDKRSLPSRFGDQRLKTGDVLRVERPGGVGVGAAFERSPEDVRQGYVSVESARSDYGVVVRPHTDDVTLDPDATESCAANRKRGFFVSPVSYLGAGC